MATTGWLANKGGSESWDVDREANITYSTSTGSITISSFQGRKVDGSSDTWDATSNTKGATFGVYSNSRCTTLLGSNSTNLSVIAFPISSSTQGYSYPYTMDAPNPDYTLSYPAGGTVYIKLSFYGSDVTNISESYFISSGISVTATTYTVSFNANGGSGAPSSQTKTYGTALTLSSTVPTRTGYTFLGWSTSSTATVATWSAGGSYTTNASDTLYAVWELNSYTVSYSANGGSGAPSSQTKYYGTTLVLSSTVPTRTGYTFNGWNTNSGGTGTSYAAGGNYTANAAATLYAQWTQITYTISYDANGGSGAPSNQTKYYGTTLTLSSTVPTWSGYTFKNWNTASGGTGTSYSSGASYTSNAAATMWAQWTMLAPWSLSISASSATTSSITGSVSCSGVSITNYTVYYRVSGTTTYSSKSLGTTTSFTLSSLSEDTDYDIYFTATNTGGITTSDTIVYSTTLDVSGVTVNTTAEAEVFTITVTAGTSTSLSQEVLYSYGYSDPETGTMIWTDYISDTSYIFEDLEPETEYTVQVIAKVIPNGSTNDPVEITSTATTLTTDADQAKIYRKCGDVQLGGKAYIRTNESWAKAKKAYIKANGTWIPNINK